MAEAQALTSKVCAQAPTSPTPETTGGSLHLRLPSRPDWVEPIVTLLAARAKAAGICDEAARKRLVVAMTEAITNAMVHGNFGISSELKQRPGEFAQALEQKISDPQYIGRVVDVRFRWDSNHCVWTITDEGAGFDVAQALHRLESNEPDVMLASGRGIPIMQAFVDEVNWSDGGRCIQLALNIRQGPEQRQHRRRKYTATIGVREAHWDFRHEAMARDLSSGGIAFVMSKPLAIGTAVTIVLDLDQPVQRSVPARIVRCRPVAGSYFDVGAKFDELQDN